MTLSTIGKTVGSAAIATLLMTGAALAQTTDTTATDTTAVGTPNTGAGGDLAVNVLLLGGSAAAAIAGFVYVARKRAI